MKRILFLLLFFSSSIFAESSKTIKVAVIDTGFDFQSNWSNYIGKITPQNTRISKPKLCSSGHKDFTSFLNTQSLPQDVHGHGTHIAGLIAQYAGDANYCLVIIKYFAEGSIGKITAQRSTLALEYANSIDVDIINYSGGGPKFDIREYRAIQKALNKKTIMVAAAGNEKHTINSVVAGLKNGKPFFFDYLTKSYTDIAPENIYYPAGTDKRIITVQAMDKYRHILRSSNRGLATVEQEIGEDIVSILPDNTVGKMTGTSQATAIKTGKIIKSYEKTLNMVYKTEGKK